MKYEMIFGDERLADKFTNENSVFIVCRGHGVYFEFESGSAGVNYVANSCTIGDSFYMRRIIKEPNRWTWEDKKAGVLPEVLGKVTTYDGKTYLFVGESCHDNQWSLKDDATGKVYHTPIGDILPIETPAEKAQREEDEFIGSLAGTDINYGTGTVKELFEQGARAAYRKLKGGE